MEYTIEYIYKTYGQFDSFVTVLFKPGSTSAEKFSHSLIGTFIFNHNERQKLENSSLEHDGDNYNRYIKFSPSGIETLESELRVELDKIGLFVEDIEEIFSLMPNKTNQFTSKVEKETPKNVIYIGDYSNVDIHSLEYTLLEKRKKTTGIIEEEACRIKALQMHYNSESFFEEMINWQPISNRSLIADRILYHYYEIKLAYAPLSKEEKEDYSRIRKEQFEKNWLICMKELERKVGNTKNFLRKNPDLFKRLFNICREFHDEIIDAYPFPIWWDIERFIHIYLGHVKEYSPVPNNSKTLIQYGLKETKRVICFVISQVEKEMIQHFKQSSKDFFRTGDRAVYWNGNYYYLVIESSGRLKAFFPLN